MKALSVRAPWWWAILHGKPVENRDWFARQRGRVFIHASKWWNIGEISDDWDCIRAMAKRDGIAMPFPSGNDALGRLAETMRDTGGCIVGSVEIVDCVMDHPSAFFVGKFGFVLRDPVVFYKPVPFKGARGFFECDERILRERH